MRRIPKRPGFLAGFQGLTPKVTKFARQRKLITGLGAFGKGVFIPVPNAPPGGVVIEDAVDASTGQPYMQDPRCPEGDKMVQKQVPCEDPTGMDPCDPGEFEMEDDCEDDPAYQQKAPPPPVQQQMAPAPVYQQAAPESQASGPSAAQQAELEELSKEVATTDSMVTSAPAMAPPSAYTGSPPPLYLPPLARGSQQQTAQQRLVAMAQEYQENRPTPVRRVVRSAPAPRPSAPAGGVSDVFAWLRGTLFGSGGEMDGWTDNNLCRYGVPAVAILVVAYILMKRRK